MMSNDLYLFRQPVKVEKQNNDIMRISFDGLSGRPYSFWEENLPQVLFDELFVHVDLAEKRQAIANILQKLSEQTIEAIVEKITTGASINEKQRDHIDGTINAIIELVYGVGETNE